MSAVGRTRNSLARQFVTVAVLAANLLWLASRAVAEPTGAEVSAPDASDPLPLPAPGSQRPGRLPPDGAVSWGRTFGALAAVLSAVLIALPLLRRFRAGTVAAPHGQSLELVDQVHLGSRATVYALRCGPKLLVLAATNNHVTRLAELLDSAQAETPIDGSGDGQPTHDGGADGDLTDGAGELGLPIEQLREQIDVWNSSV